MWAYPKRARHKTWTSLHHFVPWFSGRSFKLWATGTVCARGGEACGCGVNVRMEGLSPPLCRRAPLQPILPTSGARGLWSAWGPLPGAVGAVGETAPSCCRPGLHLALPPALGGGSRKRQPWGCLCAFSQTSETFKTSRLSFALRCFLS